MGINFDNDWTSNFDPNNNDRSNVPPRVADLLRLHELDCQCKHHSLEHEHDVFVGNWDEDRADVIISAGAPCKVTWCGCKKYKQVTPLELFAIIEEELENL